MKERPILFYDWEVRATLDGRKTQFRRAMKPQPEWGQLIHFYEASPGLWCAHDERYLCDEGAIGEWRCPYGVPGDRLWVRETWAHTNDYDGQVLLDGRKALYRATDSIEPKRWRPSIHMPRWASRITLEKTVGRAERVQEISFADCLAEGCSESYAELVEPCPVLDCNGKHYGEKWQFFRLWDTRNAKRGYGSGANPWVWVEEFKVLSPPGEE